MSNHFSADNLKFPGDDRRLENFAEHARGPAASL